MQIVDDISAKREREREEGIWIYHTTQRKIILNKFNKIFFADEIFI